MDHVVNEIKKTQTEIINAINENNPTGFLSEIKKLEENLKKAKTMLLSNADLLDANAAILENCGKLLNDQE